MLIVNNISKILENSTLCVGLTACSRFTAGFRQQLLMIYCLAWFRPGSAEERKSHISKSQVTCQSPMLICLLCHLMNENCKVTWQVSSHGKMKPRKMWPFSYKAWILSRVFKLQVLYTAAVNNGVIAEWKKLQRVKVRKLYSDHLFQKQFTFWWARVRLICKKNPLWNPLIVKNLLVPSEFGCKVVVQYMLLADIYVVCNCIFAADRLWRSGLYLHKRPLLLCWISRRWN